MALKKWAVCFCVGHDPKATVAGMFAWECRRCGAPTREPRA
jgi:hypothetical protein